MKKILACILTFSLIFSSVSVTFAEEDSEQKSIAGESVSEDNISKEKPEQNEDEAENSVALMSDDSETEEIVYEEILTYLDYEALEAKFYNGEESFEGRYFKVTGEIISIEDEYFRIEMDNVGNIIKIFGTISPDYLNCNAVVYCNTDERHEFFLCMTAIE